MGAERREQPPGRLRWQQQRRSTPTDRPAGELDRTRRPWGAASTRPRPELRPQPAAHACLDLDLGFLKRIARPEEVTPRPCAVCHGLSRDKGCECEFGSDPRAGPVDLALVLPLSQREVCWPFVTPVGSELLRVEVAARCWGDSLYSRIQPTVPCSSCRELERQLLGGESPPEPLGPDGHRFFALRLVPFGVELCMLTAT